MKYTIKSLSSTKEMDELVAQGWNDKNLHSIHGS